MKQKAREQHSQIEDSATNKAGFLTRLKSTIERRRLGELMVITGRISPSQLRHALQTQKQTNLPLGQIFIDENYISRSQLTLFLGKQKLLHYTAALTFFCCSLSMFDQKDAKADAIRDVPAKVALTSVFNHGAMTSYPALFESQEKRSENLKAFTKWINMFDRFDQEIQKAENGKAIQKWQKSIQRYEGMNMKTMAKRINELVNKERYILDSKNWGKSDYWATPLEFLKRGGDCEDFAIAKYAALRALGVPEERLRIAVVHDTQKNIPHAVLIVYTDQGSYVLDNQEKDMVSAERMNRYRPIFSINRQAWWLHTAPSKTVVASAE